MLQRGHIPSPELFDGPDGLLSEDWVDDWVVVVVVCVGGVG